MVLSKIVSKIYQARKDATFTTNMIVHRLIAQLLSELFGSRLLINGAERFDGIEWPPRSPDLTPCDFFLFDSIKDRVYREMPVNREDLIRKIVEVCEGITPEILSRVTQEEVPKRLEILIERAI